ncbi:pseudouridine synthase [Fulvivirga ulvae]|uniref:pseudouridine synthase n=1 Tax=Fulvivirga ulvae TaxID=2904245 RepID=UPI0027955345|nr:pseudouridine synthase [Fulvivirga ulvae]
MKKSRKPENKRSKADVKGRARSQSTSKAKKDTPNIPKQDTPQEIRLNKYISNAGVCSRREADKLIAAGEIKVNGQVITELGYKVEATDKVVYKGKNLTPEKSVYVLLNKPKDFITTTDDPENRRTVMELVKNACEERIYPVGRLDRNTTGLLLFTNDGELARKLAHPSHKVKKIYRVELDKNITKEDFVKIEEGLELEDGVAVVDGLGIVDNNKKILGIEIHIGKNRIVRRIFEHLGYEVIKLDRVMYGPLDKLNLPRGKWRFLTDKEIDKLKRLN